MENLFSLVMYLVDSNVRYNYFCYSLNSLANNHTEKCARMLAVFFPEEAS